MIRNTAHTTAASVERNIKYLVVCDIEPELFPAAVGCGVGVGRGTGELTWGLAGKTGFGLDL